MRDVPVRVGFGASRGEGVAPAEAESSCAGDDTLSRGLLFALMVMLINDARRASTRSSALLGVGRERTFGSGSRLACRVYVADGALEIGESIEDDTPRLPGRVKLV